MQVAVAYAEPTQQIWLRIEVPEDATVEQAIVKSGLLRQFPDLDLTERAVGIFGKLVKLDAGLNPGDRVEIYRAIIADPATVPRRQMADDDDDD
ncbi:MAG: RnfH family protein [Hydrogenophilales bacterium 28-61-23]|nr:MAG: RnfH family protein [Hydrogenophilales bacterium 28-61-23]